MEESEGWAAVASDAAELNRQMDSALADISALRQTVARLPDRHQAYIPQPASMLPSIIEPRRTGRRMSPAGRSRGADPPPQSHRARLLSQLHTAGTGALDGIPGAVVLEVLPSKRCVHFGTVVSGSVQPSTSTVIEAKGGNAEINLGEKARQYGLLLASHAEQIRSTAEPCILKRVSRARRGKREHAYDVVGIQRPARVPKWMRGELKPHSVGVESKPLDDEAGEEGEENVCSVCLEANFHVSRVQLGCSHVFHQKCIRKWIQKFDEEKGVFCPMCKDEIQEIPQPNSSSNNNRNNNRRSTSINGIIN